MPIKIDRFENRIIGILRGYSAEDAIFAIECAMRGGVDVFEVALRNGHEEYDVQVLSKLNAAMKNTTNKPLIGAGTVLTTEQVNLVHDVGGDFIVSPVALPEVISKCNSLSLPCIPGAFTPTEIYHAYELGASLVKLFPASVLGADFIKALKAPLPQIPIVAMGGITTDNIAAYKKAGATSFGISSGIFKANEIANKDAQSIEKRAREYTAAIE